MLEQILKIGQYPDLLRQEKDPFGTRVFTLLKTYALLFFALFFIAAPIAVGADYFATHVLHFKSLNAAQKHGMSQFIHKMGYWRAVGYICLIGPLLEEVVFRLPLSLKRSHIGLALAVAAFLFCGIFFRGITSPWLNLSIRVSLSALIYVACYKFAPDGLSITDHRFRKHLIILSMCLFALMHVGNYIPIQWPALWLYPFFVLPQFLMGWAITYVRFKNGFWWGVVMHCLINSVSVALSFGKL